MGGLLHLVQRGEDRAGPVGRLVASAVYIRVSARFHIALRIALLASLACIYSPQDEAVNLNAGVDKRNQQQWLDRKTSVEL